MNFAMELEWKQKMLLKGWLYFFSWKGRMREIGHSLYQTLLFLSISYPIQGRLRTGIFTALYIFTS